MKISRKTLLIVLLIFSLLSLGLLYIFFFKDRSDGLKTEKGNDIEIDYPQPNTEVSCEFEITGKVPNTWFTNGAFTFSIVVNGEEVFKNSAHSEKDWESDGLKEFYGTVVCKKGCEGTGDIVLSSSDGSDTFKIPVSFSTSCAASFEKSIVKVYYSNSLKDSESCSSVFVLERNLPKTVGIGRASLEILLLEPLEGEKEQGYFTSIPADTKLISLRIAESVAYVNLSSDLIGEISQECEKERIESQISNTMKGIDGVEDVKIYFNGNLF